jgi:uroporphyrinogen-III decarboxylase
MTSYERILAAMRGEAVDHLPFCPFLAYVWEHMPAAIQERGMLAFHHDVGADPLWRGAPCPVRAETPGVETRNATRDGRNVTEVVTPVGTLTMAWAPSRQGNTSFLVEHPLKTEDDFKVQLWIEEQTRLTYDPAPVRAHLDGAGAEGLSIGMLIPRGKTAFQTMVEHLVGTEELAYALTDYPDTVEALLNVMVARDLEAAALAAQADYPYFLTWEDSSTQNYSPAQYAAYIGPEIRAYCDLLRPLGKGYVQHACGHVKKLVPLMKADGVAAVESISAPPTGNITMRQAREMCGSEMGIIGGIEPTDFLNLTEAELVPYVEQLIADCAGGPFVLANSDSCPPGVTPEKFALVAGIAKRSQY